MISTFHHQTINKLETITDIKRVSYTYNQASTEYPHACVRFVSGEEDYESNITIRRMYNYEIILEKLVLDGADRNVIYKDFENLLDKVAKEFGRNSIQGAILTRPTESALFEEQQDEQPKLLGRISVEVHNIERVNE